MEIHGTRSQVLKFQNNYQDMRTRQLRTLMAKGVKAWGDRSDPEHTVVLFGGIVRRMIQKKIGPAHSYAPIPSHVDVDYRFSSIEARDSFLAFDGLITGGFKMTISKKSYGAERRLAKYNNCDVVTIWTRHHSPHGFNFPSATLKVDLVVRVDPALTYYDFDVNAMLMDPLISTTYGVPSSGFRFAIDPLFVQEHAKGSNHLRTFLMVTDHIHKHQTTMVRPSYRELCADPDTQQRLDRLLQHRLTKMLLDGWCVTNVCLSKVLRFPCGADVAAIHALQWGSFSFDKRGYYVNCRNCWLTPDHNGLLDERKEYDGSADTTDSQDSTDDDVVEDARSTPTILRHPDLPQKCPPSKDLLSLLLEEDPLLEEYDDSDSNPVDIYANYPGCSSSDSEHDDRQERSTPVSPHPGVACRVCVFTF